MRMMASGNGGQDSLYPTSMLRTGKPSPSRLTYIRWAMSIYLDTSAMLEKLREISETYCIDNRCALGDNRPKERTYMYMYMYVCACRSGYYISSLHYFELLTFQFLIL